MQAPDFPENEEERLKALTNLNLLDTPTEERFDRITRLAKGLFQVPIALVSLVDENRQWFKSCFGLDAPQTGRDISFCGHAILSEDVFVIEDALLDMRFHDNPLVKGAPFIRFYAGCPLMAPDGQIIGTLCIIDRTKRQFSASDARRLFMLGSMIEKELLKVRSVSIDEATNVCNHRGFVELGEYSLDIGQQQEIPMSLTTIDLELVENTPDDTRDSILKMVADRFRATSRDVDVFGRIHDQQFALLLANCEADEARMLVDVSLEKLNEALTDAGTDNQVTIATNISQLPAELDAAKAVIEAL